MNQAALHALYLREYPKLQAQLQHLAWLARAHDSNIALVVLFGSTARMEPRPHSDADVLLLLHDPEAYFTGGERGHAPGALVGSTLLTAAYQGGHALDHPEQLSNWPLVAVVSDRTASDLDPDFLANVERDGIEVYRQEGFTPPLQLAHLKRWDEWQSDVRTRLSAS